MFKREPFVYCSQIHNFVRTSYNQRDFLSSMRAEFHIIAIGSLLCAIGISCNKTPDDSNSADDAKKYAITENASDITGSTAVLNGSIKDAISLSALKVGFVVSSTENPTLTTGTKYACDLEEGSFSVKVSGLKLQTQYFYRAYAQYSGGESLGEVKTFTTKNFDVAVTTQDAKSVGTNEAELKASVSITKASDISGEATVFFLLSSESKTLDELLDNSKKVSSQRDVNLKEFSIKAEGLAVNTHYYYAAGVTVQGLTFYGDLKEFSTADYVYTAEAVDLGLKIKWSSCNLGASNPEESGFFYSWGETEPKAGPFTGRNYKWFTYDEHGLVTITKYNRQDNLERLEPEDDAAHVKLGGNWRTPTYDEYLELWDNTTKQSYTLNGVHGFLFTSKIEGNTNSIFIPTTDGENGGGVGSEGSGYWLWTSSRVQAYHQCAYACGAASFEWTSRASGFKIRPVCD